MSDDNLFAASSGVPFSGYYEEDINETTAVTGVAQEPETSSPPPPVVIDPPTVSPLPKDYQNSVTISLIAQSGATIKYTTNGDDPVTSPSAITYEAAFTRTVNTTVKAYAFIGTDKSIVVEFAFTVIQPPPPPPNPPTASPIPGSYQTSVAVQLKGTSGDVIKYTTNFADPTIAGLTYSTPFTLTANTTVRAYLIRNGVASAVVNFEYTITVAPPPPSPPVPSLPPGSYEGQVILELTAQLNDVIKLTINGGNPVVLGFIYAGPIVLTSNSVVITYAIRGNEVSELVTYNYIITQAPIGLLAFDIPEDHPRALIIPPVDRELSVTSRLDV